MFEIGAFVVYPGHGVGLIEAVENVSVGEKTQDFYVLKILDNQMTIKVPTAKNGMREPIEPERVPEVYDILKDDGEIPDNHQPWNQRYRGYMERINSGSIFQVAEVLRELYCLKGGKGLSFGEKKLLATAKRLLVKELAVSMEAEEAEIKQELNCILP